MCNILLLDLSKILKGLCVLSNRWREQNYFKADENSDKPNFTIVIPPPNITGTLHIGHAVVMSLQVKV